MTDPEQPRPRRVVVTSPRARGAGGAALAQRGVRDLDEQTAVGEVYLRSLIRAQRRLAAVVCALLALTGVGLPLLFALLPRAGRWTVLGLGLPWLLLGILAYPALVVAGWLYVRAAERIERRFAELVERR